MKKKYDRLLRAWNDEEAWMKAGDLVAGWGALGMIAFGAVAILAAWLRTAA